MVGWNQKYIIYSHHKLNLVPENLSKSSRTLKIKTYNNISNHRVQQYQQNTGHDFLITVKTTVKLTVYRLPTSTVRILRMIRVCLLIYIN